MSFKKCVLGVVTALTVASLVVTATASAQMKKPKLPPSSAAAKPAVKQVAASTTQAAMLPRKVERDGFSFFIGSKPSWVTPFDVAPGAANFKTHWHYVEDDDQILIDGKKSQRYVGVTRQVHDTTGLQEAAAIETQFDPIYQTLTFHALEILRDGQTINRLDDSAINLLRREQGLERAQIDGRITAAIQVGDLRVGDRIRYSYTIAGDNPVFEGKFNYYVFSRLGAAAISTWRTRVVHGTDSAIKFQTKAPVERTQRALPGGTQETVFVRRDVPRLELGPTDDPVQMLDEIVFVSEFDSWSEVSLWGHSLFAARGETDPTIAKLARELTANADTAELRVERILDFVQREVRYLGVFLGESSHRPNRADVVLSRRYGDCKDKVTLFIALLREIGVNAQPILVSQQHMRHVDRFTPMPYAFDHVIASVRLGEQTYWLDPTRALGTGPLAKRQAWRFKQGLLLDGKPNMLSAAPARPEGDLDSHVVDEIVVERFGEPTTFRSTVTFFGEIAERVDAVLSTNQSRTFLSSMFEYPERRFAADQVQSGPDVKRLSDGGISVTKTWRVVDLFELSPQNVPYFEHGAWSQFAEMRAPPSAAMSFSLGADRRHLHTVNVSFPEAVIRAPKDYDAEVSDKHMSLRTDLRQRESSVTANFLFKTKLDVVEKSDFASYTEKVREALPKMGLIISYPALPFDRATSLERTARELSNSIERGRVKPATTVQMRAKFDILAFEEILAAKRLSPKARARMLQQLAIGLDHTDNAANARIQGKEALRLDPMNADIASTLAEIEYGLANFGEAKALLTSPPGVNKNSEAAYAYQLGRILFQMAELKEAEAQFERSVRAGSGSARDHALIWLATTQKRTGGLPPTFAETHAVSRVENTWPTPILQYLLGFKTEKELLDEARNSKDESTRKSRLCEAYYFIGMQQLSVGKTRDAKASFQRAIDTQVVEYIEYRGAKMELAKLNR